MLRLVVVMSSTGSEMVMILSTKGMYVSSYTTLESIGLRVHVFKKRVDRRFPFLQKVIADSDTWWLLSHCCDSSAKRLPLLLPSATFSVPLEKETNVILACRNRLLLHRHRLREREKQRQSKKALTACIVLGETAADSRRNRNT